ncbi:MAG: hypothetical protein J0I41_00145 [Filimonas sp.]|nr:hypothetical protein [Filimonas sp.]
MACTSLIALPRICGAEGLVAGLDNLYIISYGDLGPVTGAVNGEKYKIATNGMVNEIGLETGKKFVEVGLLRSSAGFDQKLTKNVSNGTSYFTQTLKVVLAGISIDNQKFIESVLNQPVAVITKLRTGEYCFAGYNGRFELTEIEGGTGTAEGDNIGYTLTFTGIDAKVAPIVDETIISTLI